MYIEEPLHCNETSDSMNTSHHYNLLVKPRSNAQYYQEITPRYAGWKSLHFSACRLTSGQTLVHATGMNECVMVILGGVCSVRSSVGSWSQIGKRANVFAGMPYGLYLPRGTEATITADSAELDIAFGSCTSERPHPPHLITPERVAVEIRGGGNATRQINSIVPPSGPGEHIVAVEVYTPGGNWSSYPPHKHDRHRLDANGNLIEAALEEIYFYKTERADGFALQRVYTDDRSLDQTIVAMNDDVVLIPRGYHPVAAAPGSNVYYLNVLAGSAKSLASADDPAYSWIKQSWPPPDPRIPLVKPENPPA